MTQAIGASTQTSTDLKLLSAVIRDGGSAAMDYFNNQHVRTISTKSLGDYVSDADSAVERVLRKRLAEAFPEIPVQGEELGGDISDRYWCVDPIDGTSNFLSGLPFWGISMGLIEKGVPTVGAVLAPALGIEAFGSLAQGVHIWGLNSSSNPVAPYCYGVGRNNIWSQHDRTLAESTLEADGYNIVSIGSCAVSLLFVACNRLSGYMENHVAGLWDCAGGIAICRANGISASYSENLDGSLSVIAGKSIT